MNDLETKHFWINSYRHVKMALVRIIDNKWKKPIISSTFLLSLLLINNAKVCMGAADELQLADEPLYTGIIPQLQEADFEYQGTAKSERDLDTCLTNGPESAPVCSIVYKRFWQRELVYRLCRCPERQECPWRWSFPSNNMNVTATTASELDIDREPPNMNKTMIYNRDRTMALNNRAQFKLCRNVRKMTTCSARTTAMRVHLRLVPENITSTARIPGPRLFPDNQTNLHVSASCKCPKARYWRYQKTIANNNGNETDGITDMYACASLKKCKPMEFCGHFTLTHSRSRYATYYQCSCPKGYLCLVKQPREHINTTEILYNGMAYKAICTPIPITS